MEIIMYLAIFMILVGGFFLMTFLFAVKNGQFEDLDTPAHKLLLDDISEQRLTSQDNNKNTDNMRYDEVTNDKDNINCR